MRQVKILLVFSDTGDNKLECRKANIERIKEYEDSVQTGNRDIKSPIPPVTVVKIYFTCNENKFVIVMNDTFKIGGLWKMGDIYMNQLK
ncbi:MAG: hypothetical protein ABIN93_00765 [Ginsengibacter sp.]